MLFHLKWTRFDMHLYSFGFIPNDGVFVIVDLPVYYTLYRYLGEENFNGDKICGQSVNCYKFSYRKFSIIESDGRFYVQKKYKQVGRRANCYWLVFLGIKFLLLENSILKDALCVCHGRKAVVNVDRYIRSNYWVLWVLFKPRKAKKLNLKPGKTWKSHAIFTCSRNFSTLSFTLENLQKSGDCCERNPKNPNLLLLLLYWRVQMLWSKYDIMDLWSSQPGGGLFICDTL